MRLTTIHKSGYTESGKKGGEIPTFKKAKSWGRRKGDVRRGGGIRVDVKKANGPHQAQWAKMSLKSGILSGA